MENLTEKFLSESAKKELAELVILIDENLKAEENLRVKSCQCLEGESSENRKYRRAGIDKERRSLWSKLDRLHGKEADIKAEGISSKEHKALVKEVESFETLKYDTSIGCRDIVKAGFSKVLGVKVEVSYTRFTSFLRSVRGCGSLAGQVSFRSIKVIA